VFCRQTPRLLVLLISSLALCACLRKASEGVDTIAVLPLEDDSAASAPDGFGAAAPYLIQWQLDGSPNVYVFAAADPNAAAEAHAGRVLEGWYQRRNGALEVHVTVRDATRRRIASSNIRTGDAASVLNDIAVSLRPGSRLFKHSDDDAMRMMGLALVGGSSAQPQFLQAELTSPAPFVPAVLPFASALVDAGRNAQAAELLARVHPGGGIDAARLKFLEARISGDALAQRNALTDVVRLAPADPLARSRLADLQFNTRQWAAAAASYVALSRMQPWEGTVFNQLAYARAWQHDLTGARQAIADYRRADPAQAPNAADSLGEIEWDFGHFADAEKNFLEASQGDIVLLRGNDLLKAAEARWMRGDTGGADRLFHRYASWRRAAGDPELPVREAQWLHLTGRVQAAEAALRPLANNAAALAQLSFWALLAGQRDEAHQLAERAIAAPAAPDVRNTAALCAFYSLPSASATEWETRSREAFQAAPGVRATVLGTALVLDGHKAEAVAPLSTALAAKPPNEDGAVRGLLLRAGGPSSLRWPMPMPFYNGDPTFDAASFPMWRQR